MAGRPILIVTLLVLAGGFLIHTRPNAGAQDKKERFFEMRVYITHPGRLEALHKRFREHTNRLFQKHGIELVGYWTPADGDEAKDTLVYVVAHPSRQAAEAAWKNFRADAEWQKAYEASHADGPIVKKVEIKYLTPTDYSPIK